MAPLFDRHEKRLAACSHHFADNIRLGYDADDPFILMDKHAPDFIVVHDPGRFHDRSARGQCNHLPCHELIDGNHERTSLVE